MQSLKFYIDNPRVFGFSLLDKFDIVDGSRVGMMGWSHGGMITLMNLFNYPGQYKCGFAGVPVSDVIMRMG